MRRPFATLDVFTVTPLEGNPLAVVMEADDLEGARMQAMAREFNLSETVFVLSPRDPVNSARLRIFTPERELPFAGHPTVGSAVLLGLKRAPEILARQDLSVVLEEEVGLVHCTVRRAGGAVQASFALPRLPTVRPDALEADTVARALGLAVDDIGFPGHDCCIAEAGNPFRFVPVAGLDAAARAAPDPAHWLDTFGRDGVYLYTHEVRHEGSHLHARMFGPAPALREDPATGSAVAALAGVLMRAERFGDGSHTVVVEQGLEMGRPSRIVLGLDVEDGRLAAATIGGAAVLVSEGMVSL